MGNVTEYDDFVCEFALCTFNLLDQVVNISWLLCVVYVKREKHSISSTTATHEVHTFKSKRK